MVEKKAPVQIADSRNDDPDDTNPVCFDRPSNYEITVHGKKLIGSAQARRKASVLQHGSLPLYGDLTRITHALTFKDENARELAAQNLLKHAITAQSVLGTPLRWSDAADAFIYGFGEALQLDLQETELTDDENQRANQLVEEKYAHLDWTMKT